MKKIEQKVFNFIQHYDLVKPAEKLLISLSGGADSVFALYFFHKFKKKFRCKIQAIHFNHNLRGKESDEDENFTKLMCEKLGVELFIKSLDVKNYAKKNRLSIEEAARILRYEKLEQVANENNIDKIITAHNKNDNSETILLNLFSGTGIKGLSGIPIKREKIIRPFLILEKKEIIDYLTKNKVEFRIDSSNLSNDFKRNFLRNKILPEIKDNLNPSIDEALFKFSKNFDEHILFVEKTNQFLLDKFISKANNKIELSLEILKIYNNIPGVLLKNIFENYLHISFEQKYFEKLNELAKNQKGKKVSLRKNLIAIKERDFILFGKEEKNLNKEINIKLGEEKKFNNYIIKISKADLNEKYSKEKNVELISYDNLEENFLIRFWQNGDKFKPLGLKNEKKISDFLTDLKIPSNQKREIPVLINRNKIIWVVGLRISDDVKITDKTKRVIKLCLN